MTTWHALQNGLSRTKVAMMSDERVTLLPEDPIARQSWTREQQSLASDPARFAWVSANAGSGKTHVLTQRVIRLLLSGARPSSILCLTYTKAAASEMSNRIFKQLSNWATLDDAKLAADIERMEGMPPSPIMLKAARRLFARALETPGGLKIQTIHAFCEALLHQFPLEANVAGHFSVLDDRAASALLSEARRILLTAATSEEDERLTAAFETVMALGDEFGLEKLLNDIISNHASLVRYFAAAEKSGGVETVLRQSLGLAPEDTTSAVLGAFWPLKNFGEAAIGAYIELAERTGGSNPKKVAETLRNALAAVDDIERLEHLERALFTQKMQPKAMSGIASKQMLAETPALETDIEAAQTELAGIRQRLKTIALFDASHAALTLANRLNGEYEDLKKRQGHLDFEDLIVKTAELLNKNQSGPWIHYKLDQGIEHILVDEAQDTSPMQWDVVKSLAEDFFSGESAKGRNRTLFAVGDEKQSIYSFQGARPERFADEGNKTAKSVQDAQLAFSRIRLPLSFRSTQDVLAAVDEVFARAENASGLSALNEPVEHQSNRIGHPGRVDIWSVVAPEETEQDEDWTAPFDATPESAPPAIVARRIATAISHWIGREKIIDDGKWRTIKPGDILVLVRKRSGLTAALTRALRAAGNIPVAGADRLLLTDHIAVQDLLALGRFVLFPNDDLSLAALMKSPLLGLSEEQLMLSAAYRKKNESLWLRLSALASDKPDFASAMRRLGAWIDLGRNANPFEFYSRILGKDGARRDFLAQLGSEASDILDEFLNLTLAHEEAGLPGLQSFISLLELEPPSIKREQDKDKDEVRIMTVHASKGLEAPIVFVVDDGGKAFNSNHLAKFRFMETNFNKKQTPLWVANDAAKTNDVEADAALRKRQAEEEYNRLLYVAMTRAADRLVVCGYRGKRENSESWHAKVWNALQDSSNCKSASFGDGAEEWDGLEWRVAQPPVELGETDLIETSAPEAHLPDSLFRPLPKQIDLPKPLAPSGAGALIEDEEPATFGASNLFGDTRDNNHAAKLGQAVHRLFQQLPDMESSTRRDAAMRYLTKALSFLTADECQGLCDSVFRILDDPALAPLFGDNAQAEASIMGVMTLGTQKFAVSGRIDRMAVLDNRVIIADFKTNRVPPENEEAIPYEHAAQLAIYHEILRPLYPQKRIECSLIYTANSRCFTLSNQAIEESLARLENRKIHMKD